MVPTAYNQAGANRLKTWFIMGLFSFFVALVLYIFIRSLGLDLQTGVGYVGFGLLFIGISNLASYYYSDKMVLAVSQAKAVTKSQAPQFYRTVENLCIAAGLPMPKLYLIEDSAPNAFATGRDPSHAAIAVTSGLLDKLSDLELEGVLGHELSHIGNYDTRLMAIVAILVGTVALIADWFLRISFYGHHDDRDNRSQAVFIVIGLVLALLTPVIGMLIQFAVSRRREFLADASSALLTRHPDGLADALTKIAKDPEPLEVANKATAHLYIANPIKKQKAISWFASLFNTHPPVEKRVAVLRAM